VPELMKRTKSRKQAESDHALWRLSIGYSANKLNRTGFKTPAQLRKGKGFDRKDKSEVFCLILLESYFQEFRRIFKSKGSVDLKFNSSISETNLHIDRNDECHQVVFKLGESRRRLVVKEIQEKIVKLESLRNRKAFDGGFQH
jgi:hypothetical protein